MNRYGDYLESMAFSASTIRQRLRLLGLLGVDPLEATRDDVQRVVSMPAARSARRVYLAHLRAFYRDAAWLGWTDRDPTLGMRVAHAPPPPPRPLSDAQVQLLLAGLPDGPRAWTVLGCFAGLRASEVLGLRVSDLDGQVLRVAGKGGRVAAVPVHPLVADVMASWSPPAYSTASHMSSAWATAAARVLGVRPRFHQCRHTFGTRLLRATGDLMLVRDAMRHASVATTQRYLAVEDGRVSAAVAALAA